MAVSKSLRLLVDLNLLAVVVLIGACSSVPETEEPDVEPRPRLRVGRDDPSQDTNFGRETDPTQLFIQLDSQLRTLRRPNLDAQAKNQIRPVLTRYVDTNFDLIQQAVQKPGSRHRLVAAWSLGYASNPSAMPLLLSSPPKDAASTPRV